MLAQLNRFDTSVCLFRHVRRGWTLWAFLLAIGFDIPTRGQLQAPAAGDEQPVEAPRAALDDPDVYVNDSFEASDALAKAKSLIDRGRWAEASQILQRAMDRADRKLVRVGLGAYTGIRRHIGELIARWPKDGLAEYRRLYEPELESALRNVSDPRSIDEWSSLFERYFCTSGAAKLADTIGQLSLEAGNIAWAEHVFRRVLEHHPDARSYEMRYRAMLDLLAAIRGENAIEQWGDRAETKLRWMGQDRTLREVLEEVGRGFSGVSLAASPDDWPIFAGETRRNRKTRCVVDDPALIWRLDLADRSAADESPEAGDAEGSAKPDTARELTLFPVVGDGLVYVQWFRQIRAVQRLTGAAAWQFGDNPKRTRGLDYLEDSPPAWNSPTFQDGRLYAVLPGDESSYSSFDTPRVASELVCLAAATGRTIWRVSQRSGDEPSGVISFDSSPIVQDGAVYVVGRRRRAFGFEDCYLYRLRASDGTVEYRTHLGSASTGSFGNKPATRSLVSLSGDALYVCTNLGTIAAVSARTGDVLWLRLYDRLRPDTPQAMGRAAQDLNPWEFNPVIWSEGKLFCLPSDSTRLLILSAENGETLQTLELSPLGDMAILLGVRGDQLCGIGKEVFCYNFIDHTVRWSAALPTGSVSFGRAIWLEDQILVPRRNGLSRFRTADGTRSDTMWDAEGEGGNLLAMPDLLLAAGVGRVAGYLRKADIWKTLRERMAAAPEDPIPAVELAEVALDAAEYDESLRLLGEAVRRADRVDELHESKLAVRIFSDVLKFASVASQRATLELDTLERLFGFASQFARDAESNLRYRFVFGDLFGKYRRPERALRLYQQVLRDRSLRELPAGASSAGSRGAPPGRAGMQAQVRIAKLLDEQGREIYAPYESEARQWLVSGRIANDAETLQRIVETFPNSETAPQALTAYGELLAKSGRPDAAARQFANAYHRYPRLVDRPGLLRSIADTYERAGMTDRAYLWLTKAAREYPTAQVQHEGRLVTLAQYRDRLSAAKKRVEPSRPTVRLPVDRAYERAFEGKLTVLVPWFGSEPTSRWSHLFVHHEGSIRALNPKSGEDAWPSPATVGETVELLVARANVAVVATPHEVIGLDAANGSRRWSFGEPARRVNDPGVDWEAVSSFRSHAISGDRLISVRDDGRMSCISLDTGRVVWSEVRKPAPLGRVRVMGPWLAYHQMREGRVELCLADAETGSWIGVIPTEETRPVEDLFVTLDGQVVIATAQSLSAYDAESRLKLWQTTGGAGVRPASLLLDLDAVYYLGDDGEMRKIDLDDGRTLWQSERLVHRGEEDLSVEREGGSIIVSTTGSVTAIDLVTGLTLWRGTTPEQCRLAFRAITDSHVVAIDLADGLRPGHAAAYFYEHLQQSGLIPKDGGAPDLGTLTDVRTFRAIDDAIVLQTGQTLRGFAHQ